MHEARLPSLSQAKSREPARLWLSLAGLAFLVGLGPSCGFADEGDGTRTVAIQGALRCSYPELITTARWSLSDGTSPLTGANVTLIDADTAESIEVPQGPEAGEYVTAWPGYHRRVKVHIWRGKDGARFHLEGPSPHLIVTPAAGTILAAGHALDIVWRAPDGLRADRVDVHVDPDGGEAGAPLMQTTGGSMQKDGGRARLGLGEARAGPHSLSVARTNVLVPKGARGGSSVEQTYAVETAFYRH